MKNETYTIRKITSADETDFMEMSREFYASDAVLHEIDPAFHRAAFEELMRSDAYLEAVIFTVGKVPAGYALLNKTFSREAGGITVWLEELYLRPAYQGKGIGSGFFRWMEAHFPAARYRLEVEPDNRRAAALYRRMGYSELPYLQMVKDRGEEKTK